MSADAPPSTAGPAPGAVAAGEGELDADAPQHDDVPQPRSRSSSGSGGEPPTASALPLVITTSKLYGCIDGQTPASSSVASGAKRRLFVTNIGPGVNEVAIWEVFKRFGNVAEVSLFRDAQTQASTGHGYVVFATADAALEAMGGLDGSAELAAPGTRLAVDWAVGRTDTLCIKEQQEQRNRQARMLFFAKVPPTALPEDVQDLLLKFGPVVEVNLFRAWAGAKNSKGCGLVEMATREGAAAALEALNHRYTWPDMDSPMVVEWMNQSKQRSAGSGREPKSKESCKLVLGNLPVGLHKDELLAALVPLGDVVEVHITGDAPGQVHDGTGYVRFSSKEQTAAALLALQTRCVHFIHPMTKAKHVMLATKSASGKAKGAAPHQEATAGPAPASSSGISSGSSGSRAAAPQALGVSGGGGGGGSSSLGPGAPRGGGPLSSMPGAPHGTAAHAADHRPAGARAPRSSALQQQQQQQQHSAWLARPQQRQQGQPGQGLGPQQQPMQPAPGRLLYLPQPQQLMPVWLPSPSAASAAAAAVAASSAARRGSAGSSEVLFNLESGSGSQPLPLHARPLVVQHVSGGAAAALPGLVPHPLSGGAADPLAQPPYTSPLQLQAMQDPSAAGWMAGHVFSSDHDLTHSSDCAPPYVAPFPPLHHQDHPGPLALQQQQHQQPQMGLPVDSGCYQGVPVGRAAPPAQALVLDAAAAAGARGGMHGLGHSLANKPPYVTPHPPGAVPAAAAAWPPHLQPSSAALQPVSPLHPGVAARLAPLQAAARPQGAQQQQQQPGQVAYAPHPLPQQPLAPALAQHQQHQHHHHHSSMALRPQQQEAWHLSIPPYASVPNMQLPAGVRVGTRGAPSSGLALTGSSQAAAPGGGGPAGAAQGGAAAAAAASAAAAAGRLWGPAPAASSAADHGSSTDFVMLTSEQAYAVADGLDGIASSSGGRLLLVAGADGGTQVAVIGTAEQRRAAHVLLSLLVQEMEGMELRVDTL